MRLDGKAQNSEAMVAYRIVLDSGFVLEDVVYRLCEEANESVALRRGNEYAAQLESQHLAHPVKGCFQLCCSIPGAFFASAGFRLCGLTPPPRCWSGG